MKKIEKIEMLESLTIKHLEDVEGDKFIYHDIIDYLKNNNFNKNDLLEYIYILLNTITENDNELKKGSVYDGIAFWIDDIEVNKKSMLLEYIESENK